MKNDIVRFQLAHSVPLLLCPFETLHQSAKRYPLSPVSYYNIFPIYPFMQNKANFGNDKRNITLDMTSNYKILCRSPGQKTKPIQSQLKPKQTQFKGPVMTQSQAFLLIKRPKLICL
jgi:hypothetical protein